MAFYTQGTIMKGRKLLINGLASRPSVTIEDYEAEALADWLLSHDYIAGVLFEEASAGVGQGGEG